MVCENQFRILITGFVVGLPPHVLDPHYALSDIYIYIYIYIYTCLAGLLPELRADGQGAARRDHGLDRFKATDNIL